MASVAVQEAVLGGCGTVCPTTSKAVLSTAGGGFEHTQTFFPRNVEGTGLDRQMAKHVMLEDALGFQGRTHWQREPA